MAQLAGPVLERKAEARLGLRYGLMAAKYEREHTRRLEVEKELRRLRRIAARMNGHNPEE
jgi:hypothetical protein